MTNGVSIFAILGVVGASIMGGCAIGPDVSTNKATSDEINSILGRADEIRRLGACLGNDSDSCEGICGDDGSACQVEDRFQFVQETLVYTDGYWGNGFGKIVGFFTGALNYEDDPRCTVVALEVDCFEDKSTNPDSLLSRTEVEELAEQEQYSRVPATESVEFLSESYQLDAHLTVEMYGLEGHDPLDLTAAGRAVAFDKQELAWQDTLLGYDVGISVQGCVEYWEDTTSFDPLVDLVKVTEPDTLSPIPTEDGALVGNLEGTVVESCTAWEYGLESGVYFYYNSDGKRHVVNPCSRRIEGTEVGDYVCALSPKQVSQQVAPRFATHAKWVSGVAFAAAALTNAAFREVADGAIQGILSAAWGAESAAAFAVPDRLALTEYGILGLVETAVALGDCRADQQRDCSLQTDQLVINLGAFTIAAAAKEQLEAGTQVTRANIGSWFTRAMRIELLEMLEVALKSANRQERAQGLSALLAGYDTASMNEVELRERVGQVLDQNAQPEELEVLLNGPGGPGESVGELADQGATITGRGATKEIRAPADYPTALRNASAEGMDLKYFDSMPPVDVYNSPEPGSDRPRFSFAPAGSDPPVGKAFFLDWSQGTGSAMTLPENPGTTDTLLAAEMEECGLVAGTNEAGETVVIHMNTPESPAMQAAATAMDEALNAGDMEAYDGAREEWVNAMSHSLQIAADHAVEEGIIGPDYVNLFPTDYMGNANQAYVTGRYGADGWEFQWTDGSFDEPREMTYQRYRLGCQSTQTCDQYGAECLGEETEEGTVDVCMWPEATNAAECQQVGANADWIEDYLGPGHDACRKRAEHLQYDAHMGGLEGGYQRVIAYDMGAFTRRVLGVTDAGEADVPVGQHVDSMDVVRSVLQFGSHLAVLVVRGPWEPAVPGNIQNLKVRIDFGGGNHLDEISMIRQIESGSGDGQYTGVCSEVVGNYVYCDFPEERFVPLTWIGDDFKLMLTFRAARDFEVAFFVDR